VHASGLVTHLERLGVGCTSIGVCRKEVRVHSLDDRAQLEPSIGRHADEVRLGSAMLPGPSASLQKRCLLSCIRHQATSKSLIGAAHISARGVDEAERNVDVLPHINMPYSKCSLQYFDYEAATETCTGLANATKNHRKATLSIERRLLKGANQCHVCNFVTPLV